RRRARTLRRQRGNTCPRNGNRRPRKQGQYHCRQFRGRGAWRAEGTTTPDNIRVQGRQGRKGSESDQCGRLCAWAWHVRLASLRELRTGCLESTTKKVPAVRTMGCESGQSTAKTGPLVPG